MPLKDTLIEIDAQLDQLLAALDIECGSGAEAGALAPLLSAIERRAAVGAALCAGRAFGTEVRMMTRPSDAFVETGPIPFAMPPDAPSSAAYPANEASCPGGLSSMADRGHEPIPFDRETVADEIEGRSFIWVGSECRVIELSEPVRISA